MTTTEAPAARTAPSHRRPSRWRTRVAGGVVAGALLVAAPLATVSSFTASTSPVTAAVVGSTASTASGLPTTIVLTSRRAGSVVD